MPDNTNIKNGNTTIHWKESFVSSDNCINMPVLFKWQRLAITQSIDLNTMHFMIWCRYLKKQKFYYWLDVKF